MSASEIKITENELDTAFEFIKREGYSYYMPIPFEVEALDFFWEEIRPELSKINLFTYKCSNAYRIFKLKESMATSNVDLLEPIDLIFYTAMIFRLAPLIEESRIPFSENIVHSYRFMLNEEGKPFFSNEWEKFSETLQSKSEKEYVARADIADFFPRIYHHRLINALKEITGLTAEIRVLERFLKTWASDTSYGIPIGHHVSNLLAEALLIEVDNFLQSHDIDFIRYIDDYYFFCESADDCRSA
ncbi:MAG: RNA-directed DNA polymerase, partial [Candidatus Hodarchaeales archaeon]